MEVFDSKYGLKAVAMKKSNYIQVVCSVERTIDGSSAIVQVHVLDCVDEVGAVFKFLVEVVSGKLNSHPFSLLKVRKLKWNRGE